MFPEPCVSHDKWLQAPERFKGHRNTLFPYVADNQNKELLEKGRTKKGTKKYRVLIRQERTYNESETTQRPPKREVHKQEPST